MKKLIVAAVAAIVFIANIQAQNKKWSLKECIDYAILHNICLLYTSDAADEL